MKNGILPYVNAGKTPGLARVVNKAHGKDLKKQYALSFQISMIASLLLLIGMFSVPYKSNSDFDITLVQQEFVAIDEILQTEQQEMAPPPPRPQVPITVADETVLEDFDLDLDAALDLDEPLSLPAPPPPVAEKKEEIIDDEIFVVVEEMPEIIGGTEALYKLIRYPEIARQAGLEGMVVVQVVVEPTGLPTSPEVVRSAGDVLDRAAVEAVMKLKFKPGQQRAKPVRVKYAIPVRFRLRDASK